MTEETEKRPKSLKKVVEYLLTIDRGRIRSAEIAKELTERTDRDFNSIEIDIWMGKLERNLDLEDKLKLKASNPSTWDLDLLRNEYMGDALDYANLRARDVFNHKVPAGEGYRKFQEAMETLYPFENRTEKNNPKKETNYRTERDLRVPIGELNENKDLRDLFSDYPEEDYIRFLIGDDLYSSLYDEAKIERTPPEETDKEPEWFGKGSPGEKWWPK